MQKPKTIADLNINLEFTNENHFPTYSEFENYIKDRNSAIIDYNIIPGIYTFKILIPTNKNSHIVNGIQQDIPREVIGYTFPKWETISFDIDIHHGINRSIINLLYNINYHIHQKIRKRSENYRTWTELDRFVLISKNTFEIEFTIPF